MAMQDSRADLTRESAASAMSWPAVFAGGLGAIATALMLVTLGTGIGLASVSPWSGSNPSPTTFTVLAAVWLIVVQWVSSMMGGYLTGRLRTKWVGAHTDEVFFRDTAHGFLSWALAVVVVAGIGTAVTGLALGGTARTASNVVSGVASGAAQGAASSESGYSIDTLFRSEQAGANTPPQEARGEVARILARAVGSQTVDQGDRTYLAKMIAVKAGIPQADAEKRVDDVVAQAKAAQQQAVEAADKARKAASTASFFTFVSMLIGAFIAAAAAALGGRLRDGF